MEEKKKKAATVPAVTAFLSGWRDSNPRPLRPERSTLPAEPHPEYFDRTCALGQIRTADLQFRKLLLYPLSYKGLLNLGSIIQSGLQK